MRLSRQLSRPLQASVRLSVGTGIQFKCHAILVNYDVGCPLLVFVDADFAKENFGIGDGSFHFADHIHTAFSATTFRKVTLFRAFVTSSILGGTSLPVVLLMMSPALAASSLFLGHIVLRTISAYSTGFFQLVGCSFLSRSPRFRSCEAFHAYLTRVRSNYSLLFSNIFTLSGLLNSLL